jgi:hypothetical protein
MLKKRKRRTQMSGDSDKDKPIVTTPAELKEAVGEAVQAATTELADQVHATGEKIDEMAKQVQEIIETQVAPAPPDSAAEIPLVSASGAETPAPQVSNGVKAAIVEEVRNQIEAANAESAVLAAGSVQAQIQATVAETKDTVDAVKTLVTGIASQANTPSPAEPSPVVKAEEAAIVTGATAPMVLPINGKAETAAVTHLISASKVQAYGSFILMIILSVGILVFAGLFINERAASEQRAITDAKLTRELAQDVVNANLLKNENIETTIQKKIDSLKTQGLSDAKAIPMAYVDGEVIKEVANDLPISVKKLPYAEELVMTELKRISAYAERELDNKR